MPGNWLIIKSLNESVTNKDKPYEPPPPNTHTHTHTHPFGFLYCHTFVALAYYSFVLSFMGLNKNTTAWA